MMTIMEETGVVEMGGMEGKQETAILTEVIVIVTATIGTPHGGTAQGTTTTTTTANAEAGVVVATGEAPRAETAVRQLAEARLRKALSPSASDRDQIACGTSLLQALREPARSLPRPLACLVFQARPDW